MKARFPLAFTLLFVAVVALGLGALWTRGSGCLGRATNTAADRDGTGAGTGFRIEGRVVDFESKPLPGARVSAADQHTDTDGDGFFTLDHLQAGEVVLDAAAEGYVSPGPPGMRGLRIVLAGSSDAETHVEGIELVLRKPGQISGRVVAGDLPVAADLSLTYLRAEGIAGPLEPFALEAVGASGASGEFELAGVSPGRLRVVAEAEDFAAAESREIYLRDGERRDGLVIDLMPSGVLTGLVRGSGGEPLVSAEVTASGPELSRNLRVRSDAKGLFRFDALPASTLSVRARAAGYRGKTLDGIEILAGEPTRVELQLEPAQGLFGRVIDSSDEGVPYAYVIVQLRPRFQVLRTDADGVFGWPQAPDLDFELQAVSPHHLPSQALKGGVGREITLRLGDGGSVVGKVVDSQGTPLSQYTIAVESFQVEGFTPYSSRAYKPLSVARSDGRFNLEGLRPGSYYLRAKAPGHAAASSEPIEVRAKKVTGEVIIRLGRGAVVKGAITSEGGQAVAGAQVTLFDPMTPFESRTASSNRDGEYELRGVPAGRRSLKVTAPRYLTEISAGLDVPESGELWRDVQLTRAKVGEGFSFHGIGAVLRKGERGIQIMQTIDGHPAALHGLKHGDIIVEVDREPAHDMRLDQVIELIRGEEGAAVELEIDRVGEGRFTVELERGRVVVEDR